MKYKSKFSDKQIADMKQMRNNSISIITISKIYRCSPSTILNLTDPEYRAKALVRMKQYTKNHPITPERRKAHNEYMVSDKGRKCVAKSWIRTYLRNKTIDRETIMEVLEEPEFLELK